MLLYMYITIHILVGGFMLTRMDITMHALDLKSDLVLKPSQWLGSF